MKENEMEIRQIIDLHHSRKDFSSNINYVEFSFSCCFYEFFNVPNTSWETDLNGDEIFEILDFLNIKVSAEFLKGKYLDQNNNNVEVFHSTSDEQVFAYFDLQKESTDQNDMFYLGISCTKIQEEIVHDKLLKIYKKLKTSSPFVYDIWNKQLYNMVFRSYFYFYGNEYNVEKRQLKHHKNSR